MEDICELFLLISSQNTKYILWEYLPYYWCQFIVGKSMKCIKMNVQLFCLSANSQWILITFYYQPGDNFLFHNFLICFYAICGHNVLKIFSRMCIFIPIQISIIIRINDNIIYIRVKDLWSKRTKSCLRLLKDTCLII